jgi:hypothetical protein
MRPLASLVSRRQRCQGPHTMCFATYSGPPGGLPGAPENLQLLQKSGGARKTTIPKPDPSDVRHVFGAPVFLQNDVGVFGIGVFGKAHKGDRMCFICWGRACPAGWHRSLHVIRRMHPSGCFGVWVALWQICVHFLNLAKLREIREIDATFEKPKLKS